MKKPKAEKKTTKRKSESKPFESLLPALVLGTDKVKKYREEDAKASEDFLADVPPTKAPDLRPPMKRDALEEGYHALEDSRIDHAKALRELSGDMGRLAHLIALYLPSERREDFKREAADILNRKQEQS